MFVYKEHSEELRFLKNGKSFQDLNSELKRSQFNPISGTANLIQSLGNFFFN